MRTGEESLHQRFKDTSTSSRYKRLATTFYTDTLFAKEYSSLGHKCAQVYTNAHCDFVFVVPKPTSQSGDLTDSLYEFVETVGVPDTLTMADAPSLTISERVLLRLVGSFIYRDEFVYRMIIVRIVLKSRSGS